MIMRNFFCRLVLCLAAATPAADWALDLGTEFPGAKGTLKNQNGLTLSMDLTKGGRYVAAWTDTTLHSSVNQIEAVVQYPPGVQLYIRVVDSSGQTLQYSTYRPPQYNTQEAFPLSVSLRQPPRGFWGGAGTGKPAGPIRKIAFLLDPSPYPTRISELHLTDLTFSSDSLPVSFSPYSRTQPRTFQTIPVIGLSVHQLPTSAQLDSLQKLGFQMLRTDLYWHLSEKDSAVFNFSMYDAFCDTLASHGLKTQFILDYNNPVYSKVQDIHTAPAPVLFPYFARFAAQATQHFQNRVHLWEIWNEPNLSHFWKPAPDAKAYAQLARTVLDSLHARQNAATTVLAGVFTWDFPFLQESLINENSRYADGISLHPYRTTPPEYAVQEIHSIQNISSGLRSQPTPLHITEWGYAARSHDFQDRYRSGNYAARIIALCYLLETSSCTLYDLLDDGTDPGNPEHNFGIMTHDGQPKPAWNTVRQVMRAFQNHKIGIYQNTPSGLVALRLDSETEKNFKVMIWSVDGPRQIHLTTAPIRTITPLGDSIAPDQNLQLDNGIWQLEYPLHPEKQ